MTGDAAAAPNGTQRFDLIDGMRFIAALMVVALHALPYVPIGMAQPLWVTLVGAACRFAVPFFFAASGYFLRIPDSPDWAILRRPLQRLLPLHLGWFAIYFLIFAAFPPPSPEPPSVRSLLLGGVAFQLWFLPVLAGSQMLVALLGSRFGLGRTLMFCAAIAAYGLAKGPYFWLVHPPGGQLWTREYAGPLLVCAGAMLARSGFRLSYRMALVAMIGCLGLSLLEDWWVAGAAHIPLTHLETSVSTIALGICGLLIGIAPDRPGVPRRLVDLGKLSLGIYCVHVIFLYKLALLIGIGGPAGFAVRTVAVAALSVAAAWILVRVPVLRVLAG